MDVMELLYKTKLIAIVRNLKSENVLPFANALYNGGIRLIEVTFNQLKPETESETLSAIQQISERLDGCVAAGAGTVMTVRQVELAFKAGAKYIVSPNTDKAVIQRARELGMCAFPGAMTPTEIAAAHEDGASAVKVFPAGTLGAGYIKAVKAPLNHINLLAVGGVNENNIADFIAAGAIGAGVGGSLTKKELIENKEFDRITALAEEYMRRLRG